MSTTNDVLVWRVLLWIMLSCNCEFVVTNLPGYNCDFSSSFCGWQQDKTDRFDWTRRSGGTPSFGTGPTGDHTNGRGYYAYIETSAPRINGDKARLIGLSLQVTSDQPKCFTFWYNMLGDNIKALNIYFKKGNNMGTPVWTRTGNQGAKWLSAQVTVATNGPIQIVIEGVRGSSIKGDIAIDDTSITNGACQGPGFPTGLHHYMSLDCGDLTAPDHGKVNFTSTVFQSKAIYTCDLGYVLRGSNDTQCFSNGQWDTVAPTCEPLDCGLPDQPMNGHVTVNKTVFQSVAAYACHDGFLLQGSKLSTCLLNGNWSEQAPSCEPLDCGLPDLPKNGHISVNKTVYQSVAVYYCYDGFLLRGSKFSACLLNGNWSEQTPSCEPIDCGLPDQPMNGHVTVNQTVYQSVAVYDCHDGFLLQGSKLSTCLSNGNWSGQTISCEPIDDSKRPVCDRNIDERGGKWKSALGGTLISIPCSSISRDLVGNVTRYCTETGTWLIPQYDCVRAEFQQLEEAVLAIRQNVSAPAIDSALSTLSSVTRDPDQPGGLYEGEITKATDMLDTIADVSSDIVISEEQSQYFIETVGNLIDKKNKGAWQSLTASSDGQPQDTTKEPKSAKILRAVGKYTDAIAKTLLETNQTQRVIPNTNMDMLVAKVEHPTDIQFPGKAFLQLTNSAMLSTFHLDDISVLGATSYSGVVYKNMVGILPPLSVTESGSTEKRDQQINSAIMAVQLHYNLTKHLPSPIVLTFSHLQAQYKGARCMFWNEQRHGWDSSGCRMVSSNSTTTVCECDHLTNFAILMSPWREKNVSAKAIDILSYVGCSISILCLLITCAMHLLYRRYLKPRFRSVVLMHLSVALVLSYALFLFGADKTDNKDVCKTMAVLLHYVFLAVFFIMLVECINMVLMVLRPLQRSSVPKWLLAAAWVLPAVIVSIAMGVDKLHGYGTDSYCWLSTEAGLIWAFVGPALLVIVIGFIVLVLVIKVLCQTRLVQGKKPIDKVKSSLRCLLMLLPLTGCSWIIGIFYVNGDSRWIQYVFVVCNSLQGFVIFTCHCVFNEQMREAIKAAGRKRASSVMTGTTSSKSTRFLLSMSGESTTDTESLQSYNSKL